MTTKLEPRSLPLGYEPLQVQADSDSLANQGERILISFPRRWEPGMQVETSVAAQGTMTSGWVIGIRYMEPLYRACDDCAGRGYLYGDGFSQEPNDDCYACGGSGKVLSKP
jgi:hypothetical protein